MKKYGLILLGAVMFILGSVGMLLPVLPTFPFYLASGFLWLRSSEKLHHKLVTSSYYHKYVTRTLAGDISNREISLLFIGLAVIFLIPIVMVKNLLMTVALTIIFALHIVVFTRYIKKKRLQLRKYTE